MTFEVFYLYNYSSVDKYILMLKILPGFLFSYIFDDDYISFIMSIVSLLDQTQLIRSNLTSPTPSLTSTVLEYWKGAWKNKTNLQHAEIRLYPIFFFFKRLPQLPLTLEFLPLQFQISSLLQVLQYTPFKNKTVFRFCFDNYRVLQSTYLK